MAVIFHWVNYYNYIPSMSPWSYLPSIIIDVSSVDILVVDNIDLI